METLFPEFRETGNHEYREIHLTADHENRKLRADMQPARAVIGKLGGEAKVREITGASSSAPYRWQYSKQKGGTGGLIPQRYHRALLDYAEKHEIELTAEDFLPPKEEETACAN